MSEEQEDICRKIRSMVNSLIERGAEPSDVSFALSMIATELGLQMTSGSISVFPVVMSGITHAVANAVDQSSENEEVEETILPLSTTVH
jgi:methanogenic corrinoid protein MtbC1